MSSTIFTQIEEWRKHLLDTSKRNRLINFKFGRTGGIGLVRPDAADLWRRLVADEAALSFPWKRELVELPPDELDGEADPDWEEGADADREASGPRLGGAEVLELCLASPRLERDHILTTLADKPLNARLKRLALNAQEAETELGVNTLFAAFGLLRWYESDDSSEPVLSPLLLVPVGIDRATVESPWVLRPEQDEVRRNDSLAELMRADHRVTLPLVDELLDDPEDLSELFARYAAAVAERVKHHRRWEVQADDAALGIFHFQKLAMWEDLGKNAERITAHPLCRAIAGDRDAIPAPPANLPRAEELDERVPPQDAVHILDADSSQQAALEAVKRGANLVLDGPPGTGKSQTIANLIAEYLAAGKTVLFVSEKTAALDVVKRRLDDRNLGDFCLDLHSHRANKRSVVTELGRCLNLPARCYQDPVERMRELGDARRRLNAYVRSLHAHREPLGSSAYRVHAELAGAERLKSRTRCATPDPLQVDGESLRLITDMLGRLPDCLQVFRNRDRHPWRGCRLAVYSLNVRDDLEFHIGRLARLAAEGMTVAAGLSSLGLAPERPDRAGWLSAADDARALLSGPLVPPAWFQGDPRATAAAVIEWEVVTRQVREATGQVPEFSQPALRAGGAAALDGLPGLPDPADVGLPALPGRGVREAARALGEADALLREAADRADVAGRAASEVGEALGIGITGLGLSVLPRLVEIGRLVLRAGAVPLAWWDDTGRGELLGVAAQAADQAKAAAKLRRELLGVFMPALLDDPDPAAFAGLPKANPDRADAADVRMGEARQRLALRCDELARMADGVAAVLDAARVLAETLGTPEPAGAFAEARALAEAAEKAVGLAPVAQGLWGESRRAETRRALAEADRHRAAAEAAATELRGRVSPEALSGAFDPAVADVCLYRPWYRRMLPGWRRARHRLSGVFPDGLPPNDRLFADVGRLDDRRRALEELDRLIAVQGDGWVLGPDGRPAGPATEAMLCRAAEAERLHQTTDAFREMMAASGASLRARVASAAATVRRHADALEAVRARLGTPPPHAGHTAPPDLARSRPDELRAWTEEQAELARAHLTALDSVRAAMAPGAFDAAAQASLAGWVAKHGDYADRVAYVREVGRRYGERLGATEMADQAADIGDRLKCVDALARAIKVGSALKRAMAEGGTLDRPRVERAVTALASSLAELKAVWQRLRDACALGEWDDPKACLPRCAAGGLADSLAARTHAVGQARAFAGRLIPLLAEGIDLPWPLLADRADALRGLAELRARMEELRASACVDLTADEAETRDWAHEAGLAGALRAFLDTWPRPVTAGVARALSDAGVRGALQELVARTVAIRTGGFDESWAYLTAEVFSPGHDVSTGIVLDSAPLDVLSQWLADRALDVSGAQEWIRYRDVEREAAEAGVSTVLEEVWRGEVSATEAAAAYRVRFLRSWLDAVYEQVPELRKFETATHERLLARFADLDRLVVDSAPERIRNVLLARPDRPSLLDDAPPKASELGLLVGQVDKKRGHLPLRKLFAKIPSILPRLKPCLMMSPLAVSTYLQSPDLVFDLVIFDEASQVRPHDAVSSIYRGRQLVVAGDQKQLPPTSFFEKTSDGEGDADEDAEHLSDYESVLDVCCALGLPRRRLRWHYRSRRESLIAFSNRFYYGSELVTFPSTRDAAGGAVRFEYVPAGRFVNTVNPVEARRVAELVMDHFRDTPDESLGVIAFSQRQQFRILDELEALRKDRPELEEFFRGGRSEPFFVKNLENVQGDERDVMILGVGYGPDDAGKIAMRFGPLNKRGGERRLNVAVTRARERMTLVSSLRAGDIDLSRKPAEGVSLLRDYLDYAESGPAALARPVTGVGGEYESPFEREVAEELERHELIIHRQVGCGGFRIDLAVVDREQPGRYILAIECDGATYHSSATARDRDRLRQEVLADLGWHMCRIWSTDWLRNRAAQVQRVLAAVARAGRQEPEVRDIPAEPAGPAIPAPHVKPPRATPRYNTIAEVPETEIRSSVTAVLAPAGGTEPRDLIRSVAYRLGFERTGKNIERRITEVVQDMVDAGQLATTSDDGYIRLASAWAQGCSPGR